MGELRYLFVGEVMGREEKLLKNTFILALGTFLPKVSSFVILPILTGCLTQEEYGTYDLICVLASLFLPAVTLQIQTAAFRFLIDEKGKKKEKKIIITNIFAFVIPISVISLVFLWLFFPIENKSIKVMICIYFFGDVVINASRQIIRGLSLNYIYSLSTIISSVSQMLLSIIFVYRFNMGLYGALITLAISTMISALWLIYKSEIYRCVSLKMIRADMIKKMIAYAWPMVPNSMSMWVMRLSDRLVVTAVLGISANAVYSVANKIPSLLNLAQSAFTMAWQENASIASGDKDKDAYYSSMFRIMFDLTGSLLGLLICFSPLLFKLFIRGDYGEAYYQMPILLLSMLYYSMSTFLGGIYVACKKTKSVGATTAAAALCNLIVNVSLISRAGLFAASISTLVSYLFLFIYRMFNIKRFVELWYDWKHMAIVSSILCIEIVICYLNNKSLNFLNIILGILIFWSLNKSLLFKTRTIIFAHFLNLNVWNNKKH